MKAKKVLIIEDNVLNMVLVKDLLELEGYEVLEATEAETGIQIARENLPDLILMDIQLPGMDGLTATKIIVEDDNLKSIPVIALTSHAMQGDEEKSLDSGCRGYLTKPIDTRNFADSIKNFMSADLN